MLLKEMFSPIGAPNAVEQDIDWLDDLKFYIDNNDDLLTKQIFPAVSKHEKLYKGHPNVFKLYIRPIEHCCEDYCRRFEIEDPENKFPKEKIIELAKKISEEQEQHINSGSYKK